MQNQSLPSFSPRVNAAGDLVLLEDQDRSRCDSKRIAEAQGLIERGLCSRRVGPHILQAAIAAVHAGAPSIGETDWTQIIALYDVLHRLDPSPVVAFNRAAARGMRDGPEAGLAAIEAVLERGGLDDHHLAHSARRHAAEAWPRQGGAGLIPARPRTDAPARRASVLAGTTCSTRRGAHPDQAVDKPRMSVTRAMGPFTTTSNEDWR
jgi:hypothetical protein